MKRVPGGWFVVAAKRGALLFIAAPAFASAKPSTFSTTGPIKNASQVVKPRGALSASAANRLTIVPFLPLP